MKTQNQSYRPSEREKNQFTLQHRTMGQRFNVLIITNCWLQLKPKNQMFFNKNKVYSFGIFFQNRMLFNLQLQRFHVPIVSKINLLKKNKVFFCFSKLKLARWSLILRLNMARKLHFVQILTFVFV